MCSLGQHEEIAPRPTGSFIGPMREPSRKLPRAEQRALRTQRHKELREQLEREEAQAAAAGDFNPEQYELLPPHMQAVPDAEPPSLPYWARD
jgi:hypothetical protein